MPRKVPTLPAQLRSTTTGSQQATDDAQTTGSKLNAQELKEQLNAVAEAVVTQNGANGVTHGNGNANGTTHANGTTTTNGANGTHENGINGKNANGADKLGNGTAHTNGTNGTHENGTTNGTHVETKNGINGTAEAVLKGENGTHVAAKNGGNDAANGLQMMPLTGVRGYVLRAVPDAHLMQELAEYALDYAHSIGLCARTVDHRFQSDVASAPPLSLLPSPFPRELFEQAMDVQCTLNELYLRISRDHAFLLDAYKDVVKGDPYIARCVHIACEIERESVHQPIAFSVQRADYMSHWDAQRQCMQLKQVEVNIGQIGGPGCATQARKYHAKMLDKVHIVQDAEKMQALTAGTVLPENRPRHNMARSLYEGWKLFNDPDAVLLFVNQPDLFPLCHFEQLQFTTFEVEKLAKKDGNRVQIIRMTLKQCAERCRLDESDWSLYADDKRVAFVHMAYGYLPEHYPTEAVWQVRIAMERSTAIISPNIRLQLTGTKKIQQVLGKPGVLEHFFPDEPERVAQLRSTFTGLWGLENDDETTTAVIQDAIRRPRDYVLKAQMGGGKGNFFDDEMVHKLRTMPREERGAYILQQKIWPVVVQNYMMRTFQTPYPEHVVSELGIYGAIIGDTATGEVLWNSAEGYLCRSKPANVNQGGVCEGAGVVDSLLLFPSSEFRQ